VLLGDNKKHLRLIDIYENIQNNSMRFDVSKVQVAFTNMDLPNGSGKG
jgi:hypothetical protein